MSSLTARPATGSTRPGLAAAVLPSMPGPVALRALGIVSLLGLTASSLTVVVIAADRPTFLAPVSRPGSPAWLTGPLHGLWPGFPGNGTALAWFVSGLLAAMFALYVTACLTAPRLRARWTIATVLAIHLAFLLAPPLSYTDVFNYINYGRMGVVHHLNPYLNLPVAEPHADPAYGLSNWHHLVSPYGPLFTLLSYVLVPLGVAVSLWALKLLVAVASLAMLALVWRCAELLGRAPTSAVAFVGLNPIVLVWGLGADHNDSLMMALVMLAVYLGLRTRPSPPAGAPVLGGKSAVALIAAAFIKAPAAVLIPIALLATTSRRRFGAAALLAAAGLAAATVVAFGRHVPGLATQSRLVTAIGIPNLVGLALGQGGETGVVHAGFTGLALLGCGACAVWAWRAPHVWLRACAVALLGLVVSLSWAGPWYVLWILPFAALGGGRRLRVTVTVLGAYFLLAFMPAAVSLTGALGFRPAATALGRIHTREINALVR